MQSIPDDHGTRPTPAPHREDQLERDQLSDVADYVELEVASSWQRKTGLETRSFALVTLNLGVATLYFALQDQLGLSPLEIAAGPKTVLLVGLIASCISIFSAAGSAIPLNYPIPELDAFDELIEAVKKGETGVKDEILQVRLHQLKSATRSNTLKAILIVLSFITFAVAATALIIAVAWATSGR